MPMFGRSRDADENDAGGRVSAATINAAYSLKRGDKIGSLEAGKLANFALYDCADYRELAYWFGLPQTHSVYVRGDRISW